MKYLNIAAVLLMVLAFFRLSGVSVEPPQDAWFEAHVTRSPRPVLVKFGATWCPPCRYLESVLDDAAGRLGGKVKIVRIDVDEHPELARHYQVRGIPRVFLIEQGRVLGTHGGFANASQLEDWVGRYLQ